MPVYVCWYTGPVNLKNFRFALAPFVTTLVVSCGGISAPRPEFKPPPPVAEPEIGSSSIEIPFTINLKPLSEKAENVIPKELSSKDWEPLASSSVGDMGVKYKFWRDPLSITFKGNTVAITVHSYYWMTAGHKIKGGGIAGFSFPWTPFGSCGKGDEQPREIVFTLETSLSWGKDWRLVPKTRILPNIHPLKCKITSFDLDVTVPINQEITKRLSAVADFADKQLAERLDVSGPAMDVWAKANKAIELDNGLWLTLNPEWLHVTPITSDGTKMETTISLTARPVVSFARPHARAEKPLPPFEVRERGTGLFKVTVKGELSFEAAGKNLTQKYFHNPVKHEGKSINIEDVKLYPSGEQCVLQVRVSGSLGGVIYFTGKPVYDGRTLSLEGFDYTIETMNMLQSAHEWLLHADLKERLAKQARFDLGETAETAKEKLQKSLNRKIGDNVTLNTTMTNIEVKEVQMTRDGFMTIVAADGSARLTLE